MGEGKGEENVLADHDNELLGHNTSQIDQKTYNGAQVN
jgi:hypothetical protein